MEKCVDGGHFRQADLPGGADQHKLSGPDRHGGESGGALRTMLGLILLSVIPTGANVFQKLARVFGAGVLVPIHRIRQFSCIPGSGIQGGRAGIWCRMQNIYNRGSGDPVWDSEFVGIRGCVLGVDDADSIINEKSLNNIIRIFLVL